MSVSEAQQQRWVELAARRRVATVANVPRSQLYAFLRHLSSGFQRVPTLAKQAALRLVQLGGLGDDVWEIHEQAFLAALDTHDDAIRDASLATLQRRFPDSVRVKRLEALALEQKGEYQAARNVYAAIIKETPVDTGARKRTAMTYKAEGKLDRAIQILNEYTSVFANDTDAWQELCQLYLATGRTSLAQFCVEELLLLRPEHYALHLQYADLLYTQGGQANLRVARKYYAQSLELKPDNARALYGLLLCVQSAPVKKELTLDLAEWGADRLATRYEDAVKAAGGGAASEEIRELGALAATMVRS